MLIKINGKNKFIFVANTKCASASIEESNIAKVADIKEVYLSRNKHLSIEKIYTKYNSVFQEFKFDDFFKFGVVRNPLDWVVSWFNFRCRPEIKDKNHQFHHTYVGGMTFSEFWRLNQNRGFLSKDQTSMFFSQDACIQVNYLAKLETLEKDLSQIKDILGLDSLGIPKINTSTVINAISDDVETSIKKEIKEKYSRDYELINNLKFINSRGLKPFKDRI
ncbi:MAG: sulfotransferase family 2 domain-containing protein [Cyanobacteria bacterium P01_B01_bin.77]